MRDIDKIISKWGDEDPSTQRRKSDEHYSSPKRPTEVISKAVIIKSVAKPKRVSKPSMKD
jgi:hypothetical protein